MASIHEIYGDGESKHLKALDLKKSDGTFRVVQCTVAGTEVVNFAKEGEKDEYKIVLQLADKDKDVVLNKTNAALLGSRYGIDYETWVGKEVIITASPKKFQGKLVPGIDVSAPLVPDEVEAKEYAESQAAPDAADDDDIPF